MKKPNQFMREGMSITQTLPASSLSRPLRQHLSRCLISGAVLAMAALASTAWAQLPPAQTSGGVEYVTGGFGSDMAKAFKSAAADYPLTLVFAATDEGGGAQPYIADVTVTVKQEGNVLVEIPDAGPYLLLRLDPGSYVIDASYTGRTQTQDVVVKAGAPARYVLTWDRR